MSTDIKKKRRDRDPVRVYQDGRIAYWTGGSPGVGDRKLERCGTVDAAEARATVVRDKLAKAHNLDARASLSLDEAMQEMLNSLRKMEAPEGTIRQYRSNWNVWMPESLAAKVRCMDVEMKHWTEIFDYANRNDASEATIRNIARTVSAFTNWGVDRGYFATAEPFGEPRRRELVVKRARRRARDVAAEQPNHFPLSSCPSEDDIVAFARAMEKVYPKYGQRLVLLAFATGLRICEALALRHDSIDLTTGEVDVTVQLDRYQAWPATRLPKGGKVRKSQLWSGYEDVAATLIQDALSLDPEHPHHGWLFPPCRPTVWWAETAGKLVGEALKSCEWQWSFHWLRHAFATYSLDSGARPKAVQQWLGHASLSTTMDMYVEDPRDDKRVLRQLPMNLQ